MKLLLLLPALLASVALSSCIKECEPYSPDNHITRGCAPERAFSVKFNDECWSTDSVTVTEGMRLLIRAVQSDPPNDTLILSLPTFTSTGASFLIASDTLFTSSTATVELHSSDGHPTRLSRYGLEPGWVAITWNTGGTLEGSFACALADSGRTESLELEQGYFRITRSTP